MMKFANVSAWLASIACCVCLVLAVMATTGIAKADTLCACCGNDPGPGDPIGHEDWVFCNEYCSAHNGSCDGIPPRPVCWPYTSNNLCFQGYCLWDTCQPVKRLIIGDDYECCYSFDPDP